MAKESKLSKFGSTIGAALLTFLCFALLGYGINTIYGGGEVFYGVACIIGGLVCAGLTYFIYKKYLDK